MKKRILVSVEAGETRVAVLESRKADRGKRRESSQPGADDWRVGELYVERPRTRSIVGNIYKGVVDNVLPGMEAAFIDIGLERNGFLHVDEIVLPDGTMVPRRGRGQGRRIDELLKPGQKVMVQTTKDPLKTKGPRLSMRLSVAGRYLVYMPAGDGVGVSKRLPDNERGRLRKQLAKLAQGEKGGLIVRTAAAGAEAPDFEREVRYVKALYGAAEKRAKDAPAPSIVFQEHDLPIRVLRDVPSREFDGALIDDPKQYERIQTFFSRTAPELVDKVKLNQESQRLFDRFGATEALESTLSRRVDLPSGGYLMIDYAEALTVIDINTGRFTGKGKGTLEDTITKVNVEAAEESVRQLRLRDIGGIIVIDFIDMAKAKNRDQVLKTLRAALGEDPSKSFVVEVSPLGLVEMTRENVTDGVREILTTNCPVCDGEGVVRSPETVAIEVLRGLRDHLEKESAEEAYLVRVHPSVATELLKPGSNLHELERETGKHFLFEGGEGTPLTTFEVTDSGTRERIEQQAMPVQPGDEVMVDIEEPHMYDADAAIARIDAYVISVEDGAPKVGERAMVRIDTVGRSSASATLISNGASERVESAAARRRGSSADRRRSPAEASTGGE